MNDVSQIKLLNHLGDDITPMFLEFMGVVKSALEFYEDQQYLKWEGCHCHGQYVDIDKGKKAGEALRFHNDLLNELETEGV